MDEIMVRLLAIFVVVTFLVLGISCDVAQWNECRAAGHSKIYCWRMVSR